MNRIEELYSLNRRHCYFIPTPPAIEVENGFIPSLVFENEPGHYPMRGDPKQMTEPWVWGPTLKDAEETCRVMNERMGITERDAILIVMSSMFPKEAKRRVRV